MQRDHEWVQVRQRRWCLGCCAFQYRVGKSKEWRGGGNEKLCPRDTPYAIKQDGFRLLPEEEAPRRR
jgi:hypothetical protein